MISEKSRIVFVNDGSKDDTWDIISKLHEEDPQFFREYAFQETVVIRTQSLQVL